MSEQEATNEAVNLEFGSRRLRRLAKLAYEHEAIGVSEVRRPTKSRFSNATPFG